MLMERRRSSRDSVSPANSIAWLRHKQRCYPAHIVDESFHGAGLAISQLPPVVEGQMVVIERLRDDAVPCHAIVRQIRVVSQEVWLLGLEWVESPVEPTAVRVLSMAS
jgi:hypothetical protein